MNPQPVFAWEFIDLCRPHQTIALPCPAPAGASKGGYSVAGPKGTCKPWAPYTSACKSASISSPPAPKSYGKVQNIQKDCTQVSTLTPAKSLSQSPSITVGGMEGSSEVVRHNERYCNHKS